MEFAKEYKLHKVFETSAKTGQNVEEVFAMVAKELYLQVKRESEQPAPVGPKKGDGGSKDKNEPSRGHKLEDGKTKKGGA